MGNRARGLLRAEGDRVAEDSPVLSKNLERGGSSLLAILILFEPMGGN